MTPGAPAGILEREIAAASITLFSIEEKNSAGVAKWIRGGWGAVPIAGLCLLLASVLGGQEKPTAPYGTSIWENPGWRPGSLPPETGRPEKNPEKKPAPGMSASKPAWDEKPVEYRIPVPKIQPEPPALDGGELLPSRKTGPTIPILCYHHNFPGTETYGGYNVRPAVLEAQLAYLREQGYTSLGLDDLYAYVTGEGAPSKKRPILLSFDDGLKSNRTVVAALLEKYDFTAVLFLSPAVLEAGDPLRLNYADVRALLATGRFEIGSYTLNRAVLTRVSDRERIRQLEQGRRRLERDLGVQVVDLAYPFGLYDHGVFAGARMLGYRMAFTVNAGTVAPGMDPFALPRLMVTADTTPEQFAAGLGLYTPPRLMVQPRDGRRIRSGRPILIKIPGIAANSLEVRLRGSPLTLTGTPAGYRGTIPKLAPKERFLPLTIRGRLTNGRSFYKQILYSQ